MASNAPLIVYVDFKSPYAYVALGPTRSLADELGIDVDWRPLTLDIPSFLGSARLGARDEVIESHRSSDQWAWVRYAYRDARRYGSLRGLVVRGTTKIWDSSLAAIGMLWAKEQGAEILRRYMDTVFERFWRADTSRARETGGAGLGLAIVASIVTSLHGTVRVGGTV